ncbi:MAG: ASCH domain-containing protein [Pseudomonadota bacterium]
MSAPRMGQDEDDLAGGTAALWRAFLAAPETPVDARFYDVLSIGDTPAAADAGARLILSGAKTATSALLADLGDAGPPPIGSYSIVLDGRGRGICVVRTLALALRRFSQIDARFARAYGECDGTLATWRRNMGAFYAARAAVLGLDWNEESELVCETFTVVFRAG